MHSKITIRTLHNLGPELSNTQEALLIVVACKQLIDHVSPHHMEIRVCRMCVRKSRRQLANVASRKQIVRLPLAGVLADGKLGVPLYQ